MRRLTQLTETTNHPPRGRGPGGGSAFRSAPLLHLPTNADEWWGTAPLAHRGVDRTCEPHAHRSRRRQRCGAGQNARRRHAAADTDASGPGLNAHRRRTEARGRVERVAGAYRRKAERAEKLSRRRPSATQRGLARAGSRVPSKGQKAIQRRHPANYIDAVCDSI